MDLPTVAAIEAAVLHAVDVALHPAAAVEPVVAKVEVAAVDAGVPEIKLGETDIAK